MKIIFLKENFIIQIYKIAGLKKKSINVYQI